MFRCNTTKPIMGRVGWHLRFPWIIGSSFLFIITSSRLRAVSPLRKNAKTKPESVTHDCEQRCRDRKPLAKCRRRKTVTTGLWHGRLSLARHAQSDARTLNCFVFFPTVFEERIGDSQSKLRTIKTLCWSTIPWKQFLQVGMTCPSHVDLFSAYSSAQKPFWFNGSFSHLH